MTIEPQLLLALRHITTSVAVAVFITAVLSVRKGDIAVASRPLYRTFARHRRPS